MLTSNRRSCHTALTSLEMTFLSSLKCSSHSHKKKKKREERKKERRIEKNQRNDTQLARSRLPVVTEKFSYQPPGRHLGAHPLAIRLPVQRNGTEVFRRFHESRISFRPRIYSRHAASAHFPPSLPLSFALSAPTPLPTSLAPRPSTMRVENKEKRKKKKEEKEEEEEGREGN